MTKFLRVGLALLILGLTTTAADASPGQDDAAPAPSALQLLEQTSWIQPGGDFSIRVRAEDPPAGATIQATVHPASTSRSDFAAELIGDGLGDPIADTGPVAADPGLVRLRFTAGDSPPAGVTAVDLDTAGVYAVDVRLTGSGGDLIDRFVTHVVRLPGAESDTVPLTFALVLPIDGGPGIRPDGRNGLRAAGRQAVRTIAEALVDHRGVPLTLVPTPDTTEALAGSRDLATLRRATRDRQVLTSPYSPIDLSAWVAAGMDDEIVFETIEGETTLEEYLGVRPDRQSAVTDAATTPEALSRVRALGADQVVIPEAALAPLDAGAFPVTLTQPFEVQDSAGDLQRAAAADGALAAHLDQTDDPVLDAHTLLADLAIMALDRPTLARGVVLAAPTDWAPRGAFLDELLGALEQPGPIRAATIDRYFADVPAATSAGGGGGSPLVRALDPEPSADLGRYPDDRAITRLSIEGYSSLVGSGNARVPSLERRLLVSGSSAFNRTQRQAYIDAISEQIDGAVSAVRVPEEQTVTLASRNGRIPLNISNENLYDVEVLVRLESDKLEFPEGDDETGRLEVPLELPRSSVTPLEVDVSARSSGSFPLRITLTSPDRVLAVGRTDVTVRSTAVSGVGLFISIGAVLFLAIWWASHFRSVRRARRLVDVEPADETK